MLNNWGEIKGLEMGRKLSFSGMNPAGGKPTEENKFFMSEKQCNFSRDMRERRVDACVIYSIYNGDK